VTEWIAEVNLPAAQVAVEMGIPLDNILGIFNFRDSMFDGILFSCSDE